MAEPEATVEEAPASVPVSVPRPEGRSFSLASCQPGSREPDRRDPQA